MRFDAYFKPLSAAEKKRVAARLHVTLGYLYRLAGGFSQPSLRLVHAIQIETDGAVCVHEWVRREAA